MKLIDVMTSPWAIMPDKLLEIQDIYARHLKGEKIDLNNLEARLGQKLENPDQGYDIINNVAVIPVIGVIAKRMNMMSRISGGASTELIGRDIQAALKDPQVNSIILDIDSPGGTVDGTAESGELVFNARGDKPIVAWSSGLMASAAYWIGSAADQIYISGPTTNVGSIGVVTTHADYSQLYNKAGVKVTHIYAGKYKVVGSPHKPLSEDDQQIIQDDIDYLYSIFVDTVAKHRGVPVSTVLDGMADGRVFIGQQSIDAGLVDGVATLDALIEQLSGGSLPATRSAGALSEGERKKLITVLESDSPAALSPAQSNQEEIIMEITKGIVLEHAPDVAEAFRQEGIATVNTDDIAAAAATAERERIAAVLDQSMPGHEALANKLAFDGKTTAPEAAQIILQAEKHNKANVKAAIEKDAAQLVEISASSGAESSGEQVKDYDALVDQYQSEGLSRSAAIRKVARLHPEIHDAYINKRNPKK